jgi:hypothetical protein
VLPLRSVLLALLVLLLLTLDAGPGGVIPSICICAALQVWQAATSRGRVLQRIRKIQVYTKHKLWQQLHNAQDAHLRQERHLWSHNAVW